ncbi:disease resistance protein RUN1-like isoform X2 [Syzygium oleosum]|uniref:disease resistance protein RUN1-like isoform X2 n=1 Tax=Syzygium oleosum TaxID=219896 RepID=UPI0024B9D021|nr:disease resistance protein RUN1-like isoform X2 [Syzygium oleosum]
MAASSKSEKIYDVFLSFRGTDLRNNFVGHLYQALHLIGIYTFRDSEELKKGDQISPTLMKAIEESCISIIVFSENYASSTWCLEEVSKIMECNEQKNLTVLPVFYKVDPREVRGGRKSYRRALAKHESKFGKDSEKVKRWKKALSDAGSLSGWHLKDGDESELIQEIVEKISTYLARTPLHVAKHPVGIDSRVVKLKSMLNLESDDGVLMVGLWGQGGIGKTSLAKALYNAMFRQFEGSCFLANVRETSKGSGGLVTLQEILLNDILSPQQRLVVSNVDGGIHLIKRRLGRKKVFLILDDVDDRCQLNTLAGEKWFGNGSRIIITTRDKHLLTCHQIDQDHVYEVKALDDNQAHELLSKHAFQMHQIRADLVDRALDYAKGLPLALEVLGSLLCGTKEDVWESTLTKLSRIPDRTINNVLKVSYDGLHENEKDIFLHIACFFNGWAREYTKKVLDACDLQTVAGFDILMKRSLISIECEILNMHDLIQAMGIDIVNQECRDDPGRRSRLWLYDDVVDVLSRDMGDCAIKAIVLALPEQTEMCIGPDAFTKMRRLRLLILRNVHDSFQGPICLPNELRWFEWPGCAGRIPEFSSGPKKLVGLDMSEGNITRIIKQFKNNCKPSIYLLREGMSTCSRSFHIPGGEMPEWLQPVEEEFVSFMASEDLYNKFLALAICFVVSKTKERGEIRIERYVNGQLRRNGYDGWATNSLDMDHIVLLLHPPSTTFGEVDFSQIDGSFVQFRLTISGTIVKKWGFRIICKQLEDDLKVGIQDNQLIDPALLYEVGHDSTNSEAESSHMHKVNPIEIDLQKDLQDCQMSTEEHSQAISERNHELFSHEACEPRPCGLLIRLAEMSMAVFARCFCC